MFVFVAMLSIVVILCYEWCRVGSVTGNADVIMGGVGCAVTVIVGIGVRGIVGVVVGDVW